MHRAMPGAAGLLLALAGAAFAQDAAPAGPPAQLVAPAIPGVVAPGTRIELVHDGFHGAEGIVGLADGSIVFCEPDGDRLIRMDPDGAMTVLRSDANRCLGLGVDRQGRIVATQSRDPRLGVLYPSGETLADSFAGQPLVKPNDLVIDSRGGIYFSDPLPPARASFRPPPPGRKPLLLYRRPDGTVVQAAEIAAGPNGVTLSPDEKTLYSVDGDAIDAFAVARDGSLSRRRRFAEFVNRHPDGFAIDAAGRLYVGVEGGIEVLAPDGRHLGLIPFASRVQSVAFAGTKGDTLFALSHSSVFRIRMLARRLRSRLK